MAHNEDQLTFVSLTSPYTLKCGVPQGTILGPLLLLIYIHINSKQTDCKLQQLLKNISTCLRFAYCLSFSIPRMYADDTYITYAGADLHLIQSSLSHDLEKISKWLVSHRLNLNATKTEFLLIGSRPRLSTLSDTLELSIDNVPIEQVSSVKSLGIYNDENLTWHFQIDKLCKKIASAIGAIKRVKSFVPPYSIYTTHQFNLTLITAAYCSLVCSNCGKTSNKLQKLQNRAAEVITSSNYDVDVDSMFHKLSWKDLKISTSNSERLNGFQVFKRVSSRISHV